MNIEIITVLVPNEVAGICYIFHIKIFRVIYSILKSVSIYPILTFICVYVYLNVCVHTYVYIYKYTYIQIYAHTQ